MFGLKKKIFGRDTRLFQQDTGGSAGVCDSGQMAGLAHGFVTGTSVATAIGWRAVEAITKGDLVLTFDRGLQPVRAVTRGMHWDRSQPCPPVLWSLDVPVGALGNCQPMTLLPEQCVMVESDTAEAMFGDPFTLVSGADLDGVRGIERIEPRVISEVFQLHFETDEVVFAASGALALCPSLRVINIDELLSVRPEASRYAPLRTGDVLRVIEGLAAEDARPVEGYCAPSARPLYAATA